MSRSLMPVAATLAGLSVVTFIIGAVMIGAAFAMPGGGTAPARAGWNDGHPVGLYLMTRYWMATSSLEKALYYFTSDGRVYVDLEDGFSDELLAQHKGRHGTVRSDGDEMVITWENGKETRSKLEKEKGGFNWDMGLFAPVEPFDDAKDLVGKWEGGTSVSFSGNYAATAHGLELRDDGTFTGESVASLRSTSSESVVSAGSSGDHAGRWKLDGYALVLNYSDGRNARGIAFPFGDDRFYFAGTMYKKL